MTNIYIDESGYTGIDLLNKDQLFQAASAVQISEADAKHVVKEHFPNLKSTELKYGSLSRREANWDRLLGLQKALLDNYFCSTFVCEKKFMLLLHYVDYAVEPMYYKNGFDLYNDGANYGMASVMYYTSPTLLGIDNFEEILFHFQKAMHSKSDIAITCLIEKIKSVNWRAFEECFGPMAKESPDCISAIKTTGVSTDIALPVLLGIINRIEHFMPGEYSITHDRSDNLIQYGTYLNGLINNTNSAEFKASQVAKIKFPLKLQSVTQVDSKDSLGVQLADILVGGALDATKAAIGQKTNDYNTKILGLYKEEQFIHTLPSIDLAGIKQDRKGSQSGEIVDYIASVVSRPD